VLGLFGDEPLIVCRLDNAKYTSGRATAKPATAWNPSAFSTNDAKETIHVDGRAAKVVVLWENCQIDKFKNLRRPEGEWFAAVAPIFPLTTVVKDEHRRAIIEMRNESRFPLPGSGGTPVAEDSYVDLRYVAPVRQAALKANRVGALSKDTLDALFGHLFAFLTGRQLSQAVSCPKCGTEFDLSAPSKAG
jgi:hypothetical protein